MKQRLDVILAERGLLASREKAKTVIMSGNVFVRGVREDKPGAQIDAAETDIVIRENPLKYVSRGGLKLEKAIDEFSLEINGCICLDIGSSTGGFTDCMLQNGAAKVYAVDVGHGQLDWKLRNDERVVCMEKTNFRYVTPDQIGDIIGFATADVSFISLDKILPAARPLLGENAMMVCLIKPQFEAGRAQVGKKGVVRDRNVHVEVIEKVMNSAKVTGFSPEGLTYSPIRGPEGNIEYLTLLKKSEDSTGVISDDAVIKTVDMAFERL